MNIIEEVKKLNFPAGEYVVIGSGILAALGLREARDIDIAITSGLYNTLRASGEWEEEERHNKTFLIKGLVDINPHIDWEDYSTTNEEVIASATFIDGVPFMNLEELLKFKRALNREKDLKDIKLIESYLESNSS